MAYAAVTIGWRVLWLVAAVAIADALAHRAGRAGERGRLLDVEPLGDERRAEPERLALATSSSRSRGDAGLAGERVEAELFEDTSGFGHGRTQVTF